MTSRMCGVGAHPSYILCSCKRLRVVLDSCDSLLKLTRDSSIWDKRMWPLSIWSSDQISPPAPRGRSQHWLRFLCCKTAAWLTSQESSWCKVGSVCLDFARQHCLYMPNRPRASLAHAEQEISTVTVLAQN